MVPLPDTGGPGEISLRENVDAAREIFCRSTASITRRVLEQLREAIGFEQIEDVPITGLIFDHIEKEDLPPDYNGPLTTIHLVVEGVGENCTAKKGIPYAVAMMCGKPEIYKVAGEEDEGAKKSVFWGGRIKEYPTLRNPKIAAVPADDGKIILKASSQIQPQIIPTTDNFFLALGPESNCQNLGQKMEEKLFGGHFSPPDGQKADLLNNAREAFEAAYGMEEAKTASQTPA